VRENAVACVFSAPQFNPSLAATVIEGTDARQAVLDPLGAGIQPGPNAYPAMVRQVGAGIASCLGG